MRFAFCLSWVCSALSAATFAADSPEFSAAEIEFFEKQVRPIFAEHCQKCHGSEKQEGGLRLDARSRILAGGDTGPAIVPGKPDESELILAVSYDPAGYQMPPTGKLPDALIATLTEWVQRGAPWPAEDGTADESQGEFNLEERAQHWSFQPLGVHVPPTVQDTGWARTPIDPFILAKLEGHDLAPAPEAARHAWLRRATFDTIGLPPTPAEIEAFLADDSPEAYLTVIDRLLASPHFGERWGRHWLDLVRYAESRGHEFDYDVPNPWHYRDYVVRAVNDDVRYDRFVVEHVAGDLLEESRGLRVESPEGVGDELLAVDSQPLTRVFPPRRRALTGANESILATGFWFFGEWVHSPVDIRQEEAERFENMIDVYSKTFLGLTVACARCHDHKFDPIRQADFYALQGYLQSSSYRLARFETMDHNRDIAEQLSALSEEARPALLATLADLAAPTVDNLDRYLLAARDAIRRGPEFRADDSLIVFADFESGTYEGWTVEGDAFGTVPQTQETIGDYQGDVQAEGRFFINSHQFRDGGAGDGAVGTMTSEEFTIERKFVRMLIGGGSHAGKTCVNLLVDGETVRTAAGRNSNQMSPTGWDVSDLIGKTARIQIVDDHRGGWGNIGVDQIEFANREQREPTEVAAGDFSDAFRTVLSELAERSSLDVDRLAVWTAHLLNAAADPGDPFYFWALVASDPQFGTAALQDAARRRAAQVQPASDELSLAETDRAEGRLLSATTFRADGPGFRFPDSASQSLLLWNSDPGAPLDGFSQPGAVQWHPAFDDLTLSPGTMQDQGRLEDWQRAGRLLRSPSFEIDRDRVYFLMRGGVNAYLTVDSHLLNNGPLHGSLMAQFPAEPGWRWVSFDAKRYREHGAHLEFMPRPGEPFEVAAVWVRDSRPPAAPTEADALALMIDQELSDATMTGENDVAHAIAAAVREASRRRPDTDDASLAPLEWLLKHGDLFGLRGDAAQESWKQAGAALVERRDALIAQLERESSAAPCMLDGNGEDEYVFIRGAWKKRGEVARRAFLEVFDGRGPDDDRGSGRLDLALQMIDAEQTPIVPRVIVNRIWQHYFGRGLVPTPDDFGYMGVPPSHPELLDWLARELVDNDWSLKHIHRLILLSAAYRMDSRLEPADSVAHELDPENVLLHRMNVKRLEGEIIRDTVLAVSGRLDRAMYGVSVPVHLTPFMEGRGRPGRSGPVDGDGRRSLYISVRRNFPDPFFQAFDFPNPHSTIGRRSVSNVPAQALAMMNNEFIREQARVWARQILEDHPAEDPTARITALYQAAYGRAPSEMELAAGLEFIGNASPDGGEFSTWADYCHVLMNIKEFLFIE